MLKAAEHSRGCTEGRPMTASNNWHCPQIGASPMNMPAGQQTHSKIAKWTGLGCLKSLCRCGWSCCELLLHPVNGNHLVGSEKGFGTERCRAGSIYTQTDILSFHVCLCVSALVWSSQILTTSVLCFLKIMRDKPQPWLIISVAHTNLVIILCSSILSIPGQTGLVSKSRKKHSEPQCHFPNCSWEKLSWYWVMVQCCCFFSCIVGQ